MSRHDDLLAQGPRKAPEPETADERSKRVGVGAAAGGVLAAAVAALKVGGASKFLFWLLAFHWLSNGWRYGGWIAAAVIAAVIAAVAVLRSRARDARPEDAGDEPVGGDWGVRG